jgi:hypothetical protein
MRQRRLRAGETAVGSLGCSGNRGLEIKPVARTGSDPVLASIKRRGTEMPQLDWKAEYAHTTGMQAFIAPGVFLNPPRYWMFDEFRVFEAGDDQEFGGIKMTWMGVVDVATLQKGIIGGNYFPGYIHRDNSFTYNQGSEVYLLDAPGGEVFVMQSYNAHTDQGLAAEQSPATLGGKLKLPEGWRFRVKTLDRDLVVSQDKTGKLAHVMQDDLLNRYQGSDGGKAFSYVP